MHSPSSSPISRRRVLFIGAAFTGTLVTGPGFAEAAVAAPVHTWTGQALGAHAAVELAGVTRAYADAAFADIEAEVRRLEAVFSLYKADSQLSRLNRTGALTDPGADFLELLGEVRAAWKLTDGVFDPTVQPLFDLYARHFTTPGADPAGPPRDALEAALGTVGFDGVRFDEAGIRYARPGMAMTLNGIAQGFITDKVGALLRRRGFSNMLLDLGEIRGFGRGRDGRGWRVGVAGRTEALWLRDRAVATSRPLGTVLDAAGKVGHIFDPARGFVKTARNQATVIADTAARADALSTAATLLSDKRLARLEKGGVRILAS